MSRAAIPFLAVLLLAAGCGGDDGDPAGLTTRASEPSGREQAGSQPPGGAIVVSAPPPTGEPAFEQAELEADAGPIRFRFRNPSETVHALCIDSEDVGALGCTGEFRDDTATLRLELEPGRYEFFCNLPGHREAGMEGRLTVG